MAAAVARLGEMGAQGHSTIWSGDSTIAQSLPLLLTDAAWHGGVLLAQVASQTSDWLRVLGYEHLALTAARVAVSAAQDADDPAWIGASRFCYTLAMPAETPGVASRIADRALADLQAHAARPDVRQVLGQLHLSAALRCAVDGRADVARDHLAEASREADSLGDPRDGLGFNELCFGPTNVNLWRMSVAAELGEPGQVVELARGFRPTALRQAGRHYHYWLDLGRALTHTHTDHDAEVALLRAEQADPTNFAVDPMARDAVETLVDRARRRRQALSEGLRAMARRLKINIA